MSDLLAWVTFSSVILAGVLFSMWRLAALVSDLRDRVKRLEGSR